MGKSYIRIYLCFYLDGKSKKIEVLWKSLASKNSSHSWVKVTPGFILAFHLDIKSKKVEELWKSLGHRFSWVKVISGFHPDFHLDSKSKDISEGILTRYFYYVQRRVSLILQCSQWIPSPVYFSTRTYTVPFVVKIIPVLVTMLHFYWKVED